jgi:hypothetical protein
VGWESRKVASPRWEPESAVADVDRVRQSRGQRGATGGSGVSVYQWGGRPVHAAKLQWRVKSGCGGKVGRWECGKVKSGAWRVTKLQRPEDSRSAAETGRRGDQRSEIRGWRFWVETFIKDCTL